MIYKDAEVCQFIIIKNFGLVAVRDKLGIRPLVCCETKDGSFYFASESSALKCHDKTIMFDFKAGESIIFRKYANEFTIENNIYQESSLTPCLFEYLYFASNESVIDNISVYKARYEAGRLLASKINEKDIDFKFQYQNLEGHLPMVFLELGYLSMKQL